MSCVLALSVLASPLLISLAVLLWALATGRRQLARQILIAWDQGFNVLVWAAGEGWGRADETLSARAWRLRDRARTWGRFQRALDGVFALMGDLDHCHESYLAEFERHHLPPPYQTCSTPTPEGRLARPSSFGDPAS